MFFFSRAWEIYTAIMAKHGGTWGTMKNQKLSIGYPVFNQTQSSRESNKSQTGWKMVNTFLMLEIDQPGLHLWINLGILSSSHF